MQGLVYPIHQARRDETKLTHEIRRVRPLIAGNTGRGCVGFCFPSSLNG